MDKYEFKHLLEDIQSLTDQGKYADAVALADKIDWRRVKNILTLGKISNLYKINRRYEDARDILLLAYERKPQNRQICYALCEMYCKTGEPVEAAEFYKEYEKLAPRDAGRYILKYKVYDAFDASIDEKIEVLEKLKETEYQEKWMYELAKLYDRRGLPTKCVEVCDELVLWFGVGKYVNMALELKMLHASLTPEQQRIYDNRFQNEEQAIYQNNGEQSYYQNNGEELKATYSADAETGFSSEGNNLDGGFSAMQEDRSYDQAGEQEIQSSQEMQSFQETSEGNEAEKAGMTRTFNVEEVRRQMKEQAEQHQADAVPADDIDIQVKTVDVGTFNTMNLQAEIAKGMQEVMQDEEQQYSDENAYDEAKEVDAQQGEDGANDAYTSQGEDATNAAYAQQGETGEDSAQHSVQYVQEAVQLTFEDIINKQVMEDMRKASMDSLEKEALTAQPPEPMAQVLTQESDGQIRLVVPERKRLEKQITGQMSIEDIRAEWEKMKRENKAKQEEEFRQQVLRNTGQMFTKYETEMRDAILKKMEETNEFLVNAPNMPLPENFESMSEEYADRDDFDMDTLGDAEGTDQSTATGKDAEEQFAAGEDVAEEETVEESAAVEETVEESAAVEETVEESAAVEETVEENAAGEETVEESAAVEETIEENVAGEETIEESSAEVHDFDISEDIVEQDLAVSDDLAGQNAAEDQAEENGLQEKAADAVTLAEKARLILEEDKTKHQMDFSWEQEDSWGDETDLDFAKESDQSDSATTEGSLNSEDVDGTYVDTEDAEGMSAEAEDVSAEAEDAEGMSSEAGDADGTYSETEDADIDFESLPQEDEFSYSTDGVDEGEQEDFHIDFEDAAQEEQEESDSEDELEDQEANHDQVRQMSKEEEAIYGSIVQGKAAKEQLVQLVDSISMAPYTGNVIITGEADMNTLELAKKIICEVKASDNNFVGTVAKISGKALGGRDVQELLGGLKNGALIIEKPSQMPDQSAKVLYKMLQRDDWGIIVFLLDSKKGINGFFGRHEELKPMFNAHMHLKPLSEDALAHYARQYAYANEYSIDSMGLLALHTRIDEIQTAKHAATYEDVIEIMDDAIYSASRLTIGHFFDILLGKRYDEEDMIIITEKDFR